MPRIRCLSAITVVGLLAELVVGGAGTSKQEPLQPRECDHPHYGVHVISKTPLVLYLPNFVTASEMSHVQEISKDLFKRSEVADEDGATSTQDSRTSQSAVVPRDDIVRCIEDRALAFQGFDVARSHLEPLQLVKYGMGEKYQSHTDWFDSDSQKLPDVGGDRETSFFVYVSVSNMTGGGTNFPRLNAPRDEKWCKFIDCDEPWENGITFRPIVGSAVYWQNQANGWGDPMTLHAGLPVTSGNKVGMNIWTRQWPMNWRHRGDESDEEESDEE